MKKKRTCEAFSVDFYLHLVRNDAEDVRIAVAMEVAKRIEGVIKTLGICLKIIVWTSHPVFSHNVTSVDIIPLKLIGSSTENHLY